MDFVSDLEEALPRLVLHNNTLSKSALLYDRSDFAASPTWTLKSAWTDAPRPAVNEQASLVGGGGAKIVRVPDFGVDEDNDDTASTTSRSTWVVSRASTTQTVKSPGAYLRLQSIAKPTPHPLSDLLNPPSPSHCLSMQNVLHSMASLSRTGRNQNQKKKANQDSSFAFRQFVQDHQAICGVADGHGPHGRSVARALSRTIPGLVAKELATRGEVAVQSVFRAAFLNAHESLRGEVGINMRLSGSTLVVSLLQGRKISTGWVGDSRAIVVRELSSNCYRAVPLTKDHKPIGTERTRILNNGGRVQRMVDASGKEVGPARVWLRTSWVPGLAMSRVIGDTIAHSVGVVAEPEVSTHELDERDRFLVVASDGVFEFLSNHDVASIVGPCDTAEGACRVLHEAAAARWEANGEGVTDDITCVVSKFCL